MIKKRLLNVAEASHYLAVSKSLIYKLAERKKIPIVRIAGRLLFDREKLDRYIERNSRNPRGWTGAATGR